MVPTCQFGNLGRKLSAGLISPWSDLYLTKWFFVSERVKLRFDTQFFNVFNHPNFGLRAFLRSLPRKRVLARLPT